MTHSISFLLSEIQPESGGGTWFIDLVQGWKVYKRLHPELVNDIRNAIIKVSPEEIINIMGYAKSSEKLEDSFHPMLSYNERLGKDILYLGVGNK